MSLAGCGTTNRSSRVPDGRIIPRAGARVPVEVEGEMLVVLADINGKGPFRLLFDTGCDHLTLTHGAAEKLGKPLAPAKGAIRSADGDSVPLRHAILIDDVQLGEARFEGCRALVFDHGPAEDVWRGRIDGLLGTGVFADCTVQFDLLAGDLQISRRTLPEPDGEHILSLQRATTPRLWIPVGGEPLLFTLDSGFLGEVAIPAARFASAIDPTAPTSTQERVSLSRINRSRIGTLADPLRVGRFLMRGLLATETDGPAKLGTGVLQLFRVALDLRNQRIGLFPRDPGVAHSTPNRIGAAVTGD